MLDQAELSGGVSADALSGRAIIASIKASGIAMVLSVPDITTSDGLLFPIAQDPELRLIRVCKEDEAVGISAALSYCNRRALILIQHTGLLDSINAVRVVAVEYSLPVCMLVGLLNKEPGVAPPDSSVYGVRIVEPILQAMGIRHDRLETDADVPKIRPAIDRAYEQSEPLVLTIGRSPS